MTLLPPGLYRGTVTRWGVDRNLNDTPYFELRLKLTEYQAEVLATVEPLPNAVTRSLQLYLTPKAWGFAQSQLKKLGFEDAAPDRLFLDSGDPKAFDFAKRVTIEVEHRDWKGQLRERLTLKGVTSFWDIGERVKRQKAGKRSQSRSQTAATREASEAHDFDQCRDHV